jgi:3-hydroxyisobutyrate dehydrogenase-like beta-hydroxyacid dehydrogenase
MTSGTKASIDAALPVLDSLTRQPGGHSIVGDKCGDASSFKLINQVFCAVQIAMSSEAMSFGAKLGLDPRLIYNICPLLAGSSFMRTLFSLLDRDND